MQRLFIRTIVTVPLISLALLLCGCAGMGVALETGVMPTFDRQFTLYGQHMVTIHHGPTGVSCTREQGSPERCASNAARQREFSIRYVAPEKSRTLLVIPLPGH